MPGGHPTVLRAPIKVMDVDIDGPPPSLPWERGDGSYHGALLFFRCGSRVVGHAHLDGSATAESVAERVARLRSAPPDQTVVRAADSPHMAATALPRVSVVVPTTLDRLEPLERTLRSLVAQSHADFEVIVVDNRPAGGDRRTTLHRRLLIDPRIRIVEEPIPGISAARNRGVALASSDIVAFTDDDVEAAPGWLASIAAEFSARPDLDGLTGLVLPAELETQPQIWFEVSGGKIDQTYRAVTYRVNRDRSRFLVETRDRDGAPAAPDVHLYRAKFGMGANMAFRKAALDAMGGFDLALGAGTPSRGGEDIVMISRMLYAGRTLAFNPAVVVHHYHRRELDALRSQMRGYGVGYSAAMVALIQSSPRHLLGMLGMLTAASKVAKGRSEQRVADDFPADLSRIELAGLAAGPFAYVRSAWRYRGKAGPRATPRIPIPRSGLAPSRLDSARDDLG